MAQQKVELRKIRDLSENLNDTFLFIRQNFKPLITSFFAISGIFMLANAVLQGVYQSQVGGVFENVIKGDRTSVNSPLWMFNENYLLVMLSSWVNYTAMSVTVTCYMKLYDASKGEAPAIEEVWNEFKKYFLKVLFFSIPVFLLILIGLAFCLLPGIYLIVVFTPFSVVLIIEDKNFSEAWTRCTNIIKTNFWPSLGLYVLVYIISSFSAGIISLIFAGSAGLISYFTTRDISTTAGLVGSILSIFSFLFFIVFYVSVVLHFYSLVERHDGVGVMRRLNDLGNSASNFDNIQEQY
jgi:hypothetical protein